MRLKHALTGPEWDELMDKLTRAERTWAAISYYQPNISNSGMANEMTWAWAYAAENL